MEKLNLKFLIINDNPELIENRLNKILQENEQYGSIFDLQIKGIKGSEFDIEIRQEITFHYYDIIILGYSFIINDEYLSKHRFFEKIKSGEIVYKQKNPNWSVFDKDMLELLYEKRTGLESIILKDGGKLPPSEEADKKAKEEADKKAKEEADKKAKEEADKKAKEEADKKAKEEIKDGGKLPPSEKIQEEILDETSEFLEEQEKIFAIFQNEKKQKKEIPPKKINQEKKEEYEEIKKEFTLTEEEILKVLNPEKTETEEIKTGWGQLAPNRKNGGKERRISIPIEEEIKEDGGNLPPSEEVESEEQGKTYKKRGLGINLQKFIKKEQNPASEDEEIQETDGGSYLPSETQVPQKEETDSEETLEVGEKKKKGFSLPSFGLKNTSMKDGGNLPPREFKGDIGFFGNDRGVGTTFIAFTLAKVLSKNDTVAFIDMTGRTYKKILELKEKSMIDFDIYNKDNYIDAYRKNTDIKIFDFGEIDLNSESYFAEFERCNLKFLVGVEDDLKIFSMNKNYHYNEKNPDFYTVINFKEEYEERELQKEYQGLNIVTIPFLKENIDDILKLIR